MVYLTKEFLKKIETNQIEDIYIVEEIDDEGAKALAASLTGNSSVQSLELTLGDEGAKAIAEALKGNSALRSLELSGGVGPEGAKAIAEALKGNSTLVGLKLSGTSMGYEGVKAIALALKGNSTLSTLELPCMDSPYLMEDERAKAIALALKGNSTLRKFTFSGYSISYEGAKALADALEGNNTLRCLILENNKINDEGAKALAAVLKGNIALLELNLRSNKIGDEGAKAIAEILKRNSTLLKLLLHFNNIGDEGAKALAEALKDNTGLQELSLSYGDKKIGNEGGKALADALEENRTLHFLTLSSHIPDEEIKAKIKALLARNFKESQKNKELHPQEELDLEKSSETAPFIYTPATLNATNGALLLDFLEQQMAQQATPPNSKPSSALEAMTPTLAMLVRELKIIKDESLLPQAFSTEQFNEEKHALEQQLQKYQKQQKSLEDRLIALEQSITKKDSTQQDQLAEIHKQLNEIREQLGLVKLQQQDLLALQQAKLERYNAQIDFQQEPNLLLFYRIVTITLEEIFIGCKAISSKFITPDSKGTLGKTAICLELLGTAISLLPVPGSSTAAEVAKGAGSALSYIDIQRQKNMLANISQLGTLGELKKVAEATARQLTRNYKRQLLALKSHEEEQQLAKQNFLTATANKSQQIILEKQPKTAIQNLAEFGVIKILEFLQSGTVKSNVLLKEQLSSAVVTPPSMLDKAKQSVSHALGMNSVTTKDGKSWHLENIYLKPGIETVDGTRYTGAETEPALYGYRYGTEEEAKALKLTAKPSGKPPLLAPKPTLPSTSSKGAVAATIKHISEKKTAIEPKADVPASQVVQLQKELEEMRRQQLLGQQQIARLQEDSKRKDVLLEGMSKQLERLEQRLDQLTLRQSSSPTKPTLSDKPKIPPKPLFARKGVYDN